MKKLSLLWGIALTLLLSFSTVHAEDYWQDTLWTRKIPFGGHVYSKVMFHPDGKSFFTASDHYLYRYDVQTGTIISTFEMKEKGYIRDYRISRDKQNLILISDIRNNGNIPCLEVWNIDTGYVRHYRYDNIKSSLQTMTVAMGKNDSLLYVGVEHLNGSTHIIDYKTGKFIETKKGAGKHIDITSDGQYMVSALLNESSNGICKLIDMEKWETLAQLSRVYEPKFSPDGRFFAGRNESENILLYDMENKKGYILKGHTGRVSDMCFTNNSQYLISCSKGETSSYGYRIWDVNTKKLHFGGPKPFNNGGSMAISPLNDVIVMGGGTNSGLFAFRSPNVLASIPTLNDVTKLCLEIFPSPSTNELSIIIRNEVLQQNSYIRILTIEGKEVQYFPLNNLSKISINTQNLPSGHYIVQLYSNSMMKCSSPFIINR